MQKWKKNNFELFLSKNVLNPKLNAIFLTNFIIICLPLHPCYFMYVWYDINCQNYTHQQIQKWHIAIQITFIRCCVAQYIWPLSYAASVQRTNTRTHTHDSITSKRQVVWFCCNMKKQCLRFVYLHRIYLWKKWKYKNQQIYFRSHRCIDRHIQIVKRKHCFVKLLAFRSKFISKENKFYDEELTEIDIHTCAAFIFRRNLEENKLNNAQWKSFWTRWILVKSLTVDMKKIA